MKVTIIEKKEGLLEVEFDDKVLPNALLGALARKKVDAYVYEPHPLLMRYRIHVEAHDAMKELQGAIKVVEAEWSEFGKELKSRLKPSKKDKEKKPAKKK